MEKSEYKIKMSFLDKIKRLFEEEKKEVKSEEVKFNSLQLILEKKEKENTEKKESIKNSVKNHISQFSKEISEQIKVLRTVTLEKRKEEEKLKLIVRENLKFYIEHLEKIVKDLSETEDLEAEEYLSNIDKIISSFRKNSAGSFNKATFLIGKELEKSEEITENLFRSIGRTLIENKTIFEEAQIISNIKCDFVKLEEISTEEIEKKVVRLEEEIKELEKEIEDKKEEKKKIESSQEYEKSKEYWRNVENRKRELERKISSVKQEIDLKGLSKQFHGDIKKSITIQKYINNFQSAITEDNQLQTILKEAGKNINLDEIKNEIDTLNHLDVPEIDKRIGLMTDSIRKLESSLADSINSVSQEKERKEKLSKKKEELIKEIKEKSKKMNIDIND